MLKKFRHKLWKEKKEEGTYDVFSCGIDDRNPVVEDGDFPLSINEKLPTGYWDRHFAFSLLSSHFSLLTHSLLCIMGLEQWYSGAFLYYIIWLKLHLFSMMRWVTRDPFHFYFFFFVGTNIVVVFLLPYDVGLVEKIVLLGDLIYIINKNFISRHKSFKPIF